MVSSFFPRALETRRISARPYAAIASVIAWKIQAWASTQKSPALKMPSISSYASEFIRRPPRTAFSASKLEGGCFVIVYLRDRFPASAFEARREEFQNGT